MDNPYHCEHENVELRERTFSDGSVHYADQCLRCGRQTRTYKHDSNEVAQAKLYDNISSFDEQLHSDFYHQGLAKLQQQRADKRADERVEWFAWYNEYLQSPEWKAKRAKVLERDGHLCQGCLDARAIMAHHTSYRNVGNEFCFELESVCGRCHERLHENVQGDAAVRASVPR